MPRDYKNEYAAYQGKPEQIAKRSERNKARAVMVKAGLAHKGDGQDIDHRQALSKGGANVRSNLRVVSASDNRSFPRNAQGKMISNT